MKTILVTAIQISPERQRQSFDPEYINELRESIQDESLFNAVVLRDIDGGRKQLVQGECRLRAIRDLWDLGGDLYYDGQLLERGTVPYVNLGDLEPLAAELAELSENIKRRSLSWQEHAAATARILRIRTEQAHRAGDPPPPVAEIAKEVRGSKLGIHQENTRREIIVARHLHDPEVKSAKSLDEAFKALKRKEQTAKNVALAETVGRTYSLKSHTLLNEDSLAWMPECADNFFDVILTDPPYGMGSDQFGDSGVTGRRLGIAEHGYEDSKDVFEECRRALLLHGYNITKPQAHLYMFCDLEYFLESRDLFEMAGWQVHRTPLIWHKPNALRVPWPEHGPRRSYELILYAVKGKKLVNLIGSDVITCAQDSNLGHMAQKPVALYVELLKRSVRPGDQILDPFAGTGPLIPAAHEMKCYATCIEKDTSSYGIMLKRAEGLDRQVDIEEMLK